jgi:hypothetical protein
MNQFNVHTHEATQEHFHVPRYAQERRTCQDVGRGCLTALADLFVLVLRTLRTRSTYRQSNVAR